MVFFFTLSSDPQVKCYMGRDKFENEDLIKWGWPEDIWFHVDDHSSAHVYVRLPPGKGMDDLTDEMIEECCQLTKANSIEGCKLSNVRIVYTPWSNLLKTAGMAPGQVSFKNEQLRRYYTVSKKDTKILNCLNKTKVTRDDIDLRAEREKRDEEEAVKNRIEAKAKIEQERLRREEEAKAREIQSYSSLMAEANAPRIDPPDEDDFM